MTLKPRFSHGTSLATSRSMRFRAAALFSLPILALAPVASAQTITINTSIRNGSPRASELPAGVVASTDPVGLRDCSCESWTFTGSVSGTISGANPMLQFWVGSSATACTASAMRVGSGTLTPSCWPIPGEIIPSQGVQPGFSVTIPSALLVNPVTRTCTPLPSLNTSGSTFFTVLGIGPTEMPPQATQEIPFNFDPPLEPSTVAATAQESAAQVTWTIGSDGTGTTTVDEAGNVIVDEAGTTGVVSPTVFGFYVLCFPGPPPTFDAGQTDACTPVNVGDAQFDVTDSGFVDDLTDTVDATDATTDIATGTDVVAPESGVVDTSCAAAVIPANFNANNDAQFNQYRCSPLITRTSTSYTVQGLTNGSNYRFGVVTQDTAGNRSVLVATQTCVVPQPVTDFWEHYQGSGGLAQPGFCATRPGPVGLRGVVPIVFAGLGLVAWRRRRKAKKDLTPRGDA